MNTANIVLPPDEDRGRPVLIATGVVHLIAFAIYGLRMYARLASQTSLYWDDYLMTAAVVSIQLSAEAAASNQLRYTF